MPFREHIEGKGHELFKYAAKLNYEGIILDAPHRSDRNDGWLKVKTIQRDEFLVVGFIIETLQAWRRSTLDSVISQKSKLSKPLRKSQGTVCRLLRLAEIEYRDITSEGSPRASSFRWIFRK
ncbi:hypothetical protein [Bradyrhizobium embrapense]